MATVQIADIYEPATFARRSQLAQTRLNRFLAAGLIARDPLIAAQFATGGRIGEIAHIDALGLNEPNYSSDDPAVKSTPKKITTGKQTLRLASRNESWSSMDLARELALQDPVEGITNSIGRFWAADDEKRLINSCLGLLADNVANFSGDMLISVANDLATAILDADKIHGDAVVDVCQTLGDHSFNISAIAMHSVPFATLQKLKLVEWIKRDATTLAIPTYLGKRVVVDDSLPAVAGTNRITYTSVLFGDAVFGMADTKVLNASEMKRDPDAGNGGGQDTIHSRVANVLHPMGFSFLSASVAAASATYAELANAANWTRVVDRKLVPMAFLQTNG